jgi:hypothetical protein
MMVYIFTHTILSFFGYLPQMPIIPPPYGGGVSHTHPQPPTMPVVGVCSLLPAPGATGLRAVQHNPRPGGGITFA